MAKTTALHSHHTTHTQKNKKQNGHNPWRKMTRSLLEKSLCIKTVLPTFRSAQKTHKPSHMAPRKIKNGSTVDGAKHPKQPARNHKHDQHWLNRHVYSNVCLRALSLYYKLINKKTPAYCWTRNKWTKTNATPGPTPTVRQKPKPTTKKGPGWAPCCHDLDWRVMTNGRRHHVNFQMNILVKQIEIN